MKTGAYIAISVASIVLICAIFFGGFFAGRLTKKPELVVKRDTIVSVMIKTDTVTKYKPQYITKVEKQKELVEVEKIVEVHDTTFALLPLERKEYLDSNYHAVVTGIRPELEEISVYSKTKTITQTITVTEKEKPKRATFSLQLGFGGQYGLLQQQFDVGPYLGGGLSLNF